MDATSLYPNLKRIHVLVFCLLAVPLFSQTGTATSDFWERVRFGGGLGLGFGNRSFNVTVAPSAIYPVDRTLSVGLGLNFSYAKFDEAKLTAYGGSILTYINPIRQLQGSVEFEQLRIHRNFDSFGVGTDDDYWLPALFLGLGYNSGNFVIGLRYDVLYEDGRSLYADPLVPFFRVYF